MRDLALRKISTALAVILLAAAPLCAQPSEDRSVFEDGAGVSGKVRAAVVQPDGKIIIGGEFDSVNRVPRRNIARINPDGTLDRTIFEGPESGIFGTVYCLALDKEGAILVGGEISRAAEALRQNVVRFLPDGSVDKNFAGGKGPNGTVYSILVTPDQSVIIGGEFSTFGGDPRGNVARIKPDGTLDDPIVQPRGALRGRVNALALEVPEDVVAAGDFSLENEPTRGIFRLQPSGE